MFQGDIVMTPDIRNSLNSRGILVPGDDPGRFLPQGWGRAPVKKPQRRPKRALMKVSSGNDLRWPIGSDGMREVPYEITSSNSKFHLLPILSQLQLNEKTPYFVCSF